MVQQTVKQTFLLLEKKHFTDTIILLTSEKINPKKEKLYNYDNNVFSFLSIFECFVGVSKVGFAVSVGPGGRKLVFSLQDSLV